MKIGLSMYSSKKQQGFTLIELVVVIVILGILAATAAPKFINLSADAKKATLQGVKGAMASAADLVYAKAVVEGNENDHISTPPGGYPTLDDGTTEIYKGYPAPTEAGIVAVVNGLTISTTGDWSVFVDVTDETVTVTHQTGVALTEKPTTCFVQYQLDPGADVVIPEITVDDTGC